LLVFESWAVFSPLVIFCQYSNILKNVRIFFQLSRERNFFKNCLFWQEEKIRLTLKEQIRPQRAMDHFSASEAYEIDNPLMAVFFVSLRD